MLTILLLVALIWATVVAFDWCYVAAENPDNQVRAWLYIALVIFTVFIILCLV